MTHLPPTQLKLANILNSITSSSVSSVASSSSVLTDLSHKSNVSEGEEKLTSVSTILDRLEALKVSDLVCKTKVAVNLAPCGKRMCKSMNKPMAAVSIKPEQRVTEFPGEHLNMSSRKLFSST